MRVGTSIALSVVVLGAAVGFEIHQLIPKDSATKATVDQAVVRFRKEMKRATNYPKHPEAEIPPFGVYRYSTRGSEAIGGFTFDTAHSYNGVSTVSLSPIPCGIMERWQPLIERWTEGRLCLGPKTSRIVTVSDFNEFFEESKLVSYACVGGKAPYASELRPGLHWRYRCKAEKGTVSSATRVVGLGALRVAGRPIAAVRVRSVARLRGDPDGSARQDSWLRRSDGLLLRRIASSRAHVDASGGGDFNEHYEISLISIKPQR